MSLLGTQKVVAETLLLNQSAVVTAYELDLTPQGGEIYYFVPESDTGGNSLLWQGITYYPYPISVTGFKMANSTAGGEAHPTLTTSNVAGFMSALVLAHNDLIRCKVTRRRTYEKFLDSRPDADPTAEFPPDIYYISRKLSEDKVTATFELSSPMDIEDRSFPGRRILGNLCQWKYRGGECPFTTSVCVAEGDGTPIDPDQNYRGAYLPDTEYNTGDVIYIFGYGQTSGTSPTRIRRLFRCKEDGVTNIRPPNQTYWTEDSCSKRVVDGCNLRFGSAYRRSQGLPYGGFDGVERLPF